MIGRVGSSGLLRCNQSANFTLHPLYSTVSTKVRSLAETLNVVTPGTPLSVSAECRGLAVPGPARRDAKYVEVEKGGPAGGWEEVKA